MHNPERRFSNEHRPSPESKPKETPKSDAMSFEKTTPYPPDRKERYHKRSEIVAKVEEKRLPSVENITKMQEVMFEKFGLLPEDLF